MTIIHDATVPSHEARPYSTKRDGLTITNCDSEPVQTPGCVQAYGALLVLRRTDLCILQASENVDTILGHCVSALLGAQVSVVLGAKMASQLIAFLTNEPIDRNPLYFSTLPSVLKNGCQTPALHITAHTVDDLVILEFEAAGPTEDLGFDFYDLATRTVAQLSSASSLLELCNIVADEIRRLSGMDRVMVYKFHEDGHGEVFAESKRNDLAPWLGLHYPAEDIPKPARDVFIKTWLRPIPDMSDALAELVPLLNPDTRQPLDMTYCFLRGVSKMCTEYYRNMGVAATLTMSIRRGDRLWGLISCTYHAGPKYLSYQVRAACEFLAQVVSLQHNAVEDKESAVYRLELNRVHECLVRAVQERGLDALTNDAVSILDVIDAGGAAVRLDNCWYCMGITPNPAELAKLATWCDDAKVLSSEQPLYATSCLSTDYPPGAAFAAIASGVMILRFSRTPTDLMLWFKPETMQTVKWSGNPTDKPTVVGPNGPRLTPRVSFELFVESVRGRSLPWKQVELDACARLRLQLIEVETQKSASHLHLQSEFAGDSGGEDIDAFKHMARRELQHPLRAVHRYSTALVKEGHSLHENDRGKLYRIARLAQRMDSLVSSLLHFSQAGKRGLTDEIVDLDGVIAEAIAVVNTASDTPIEFVIPRTLSSIACNREWCREIFINLLTNALRYNTSIEKRVEIGTIRAGETHLGLSLPRSAKKHVLYYVADNGIGIEEKYFPQIFKLFKRLHGQDEYGGGPGTGLTLTRKLVERHRGQIWLSSEIGKGTTFFFTLPEKEFEGQKKFPQVIH